MSAAHAQIYVVNVSSNTIGEYNTDGTTVNASLIPGLKAPDAIAASGSYLFVVNTGDNTIGEYTTSGATVNASLIKDVNGPVGIAVSGSDLFVTDFNGKVGEYVLGSTPGTVKSSFPSLISGLSNLWGIAVSGSNLYVVSSYLSPHGVPQPGTGSVGVYALGSTPGTVTPSNPALISGLSFPRDIAVSGSYLFITSSATEQVFEFTTSGVGVGPSQNHSLPYTAADFGVAVSGSYLYTVKLYGGGEINKYTLGSIPGTVTVLNPGLVPGLKSPFGLAVEAQTADLPLAGSAPTKSPPTITSVKSAPNPPAANPVPTGSGRSQSPSLFVTMQLREASTLEEQKRYDEALDSVNAAIKAEPKNPDTYGLRGSIYAEKDLWDQAEKDYKTVVQLDDKNVQMKFNLAEIEFMKKNYDEARAGYAAVGQDPDLGDLAVYKVFLCDLFGGHVDVAAKELAAFNQAGSNASYYFANAAWSVYHRKTEEARGWLTSAVGIYAPDKINLYSASLFEIGCLPLPPPPQH